MVSLKTDLLRLLDDADAPDVIEDEDAADATDVMVVLVGDKSMDVSVLSMDRFMFVSMSMSMFLSLVVWTLVLSFGSVGWGCGLGCGVVWDRPRSC